MLAAFGITAYELMAAHRFQQVDAELEVRVSALRHAISDARRDFGPPLRDRDRDSPFSRRMKGPPPWEEREEGPPHPRPERLRQSLIIPPATAALFGSDAHFYFVIWSREGAVLRKSDNAPADIPQPSALERNTLPHARMWSGYRELIHCSGVGDCVVAGRSVADELHSATALAWLLPLAGATVLLVGLAVGWWIITHAVKPVEQIEATAAEISQGKLGARVPVENPESELGRLSAVLNATFARLEAAFERQQQFTSGAAHELRTPLAIMISEAQTTLARTREAAEYRQSLEECLETAQQMRRLTDTLLDLARLDTPTAGSGRCEVDLADVARRCIAQLQPMAASREVVLKHDLSQACVINQPERISLVVTNLLLNAISYNRRGGEVTTTTRSGSAGSAILSVADTGTGISAADLPHIFDRFYRADKVRSRAGGHAGLGLSICKAILDAEQGTIQVESEIGKGTVFTVRFPVALRTD